MESPLSLFRMHWDHEPRMYNLFICKQGIVRFMERERVFAAPCSPSYGLPAREMRPQTLGQRESQTRYWKRRGDHFQRERFLHYRLPERQLQGGGEKGIPVGYPVHWRRRQTWPIQTGGETGVQKDQIEG